MTETQRNRPLRAARVADKPVRRHVGNRPARFSHFRVAPPVPAGEAVIYRTYGRIASGKTDGLPCRETQTKPYHVRGRAAAEGESTP